MSAKREISLPPVRDGGRSAAIFAFAGVAKASKGAQARRLRSSRPCDDCSCPFTDPFHTHTHTEIFSFGLAPRSPAAKATKLGARLGIYARRESNAFSSPRRSSRVGCSERKRDTLASIDVAAKIIDIGRRLKVAGIRGVMSRRVSEIYENIIPPGNSLKVSE